MNIPWKLNYDDRLAIVMHWGKVLKKDRGLRLEAYSKKVHLAAKTSLPSR